MFHRNHWIAILSILITLSLFAQPVLASARVGKALDLAAIDAFLNETIAANRIPGVAVGIVQGDQVVFLRGYGEAAPGVPVTPQTQFYIGSVTKTFTALAAMQLVAEGKLALDAPVQQYLPEFQVADAAASSTITVRHLLNHTSGLTEAGDPNAAVATDSLEEEARLLNDARLASPPGTRYQYFNQNYRLLGRLIEQVSGQAYGDYLRDHIFAPLGMASTTADPAGAPRLSQGYGRVFGFALPRAQRFVPGWLPSGYLISTAEDMTAFLRAQIHNRQADGSPMLDPQLLATMRSLPAGVESEYGMGWLVMEDGEMLAHGGALDNFQTFQVIRPREELGLVILYNQNGLENMLLENNAIRDGLLKLLNGEPAQAVSYGWVGWLLLALALADLFNHLRLFRALPGWAGRAAGQNTLRVRAGVAAGVLIPAFILFGLPPLVGVIKGGPASWAEPLQLLPDLAVWLLLGMSLTLVRGLLRALALIRRRS